MTGWLARRNVQRASSEAEEYLYGGWIPRARSSAHAGAPRLPACQLAWPPRLAPTREILSLQYDFPRNVQNGLTLPKLQVTRENQSAPGERAVFIIHVNLVGHNRER